MKAFKESNKWDNENWLEEIKSYLLLSLVIILKDNYEYVILLIFFSCNLKEKKTM